MFWLSFPWLLAVPLVAYAIVPAGYPQAVSIGVVVVAVAPLVISFASSMVGRLPGFRWMLATPQPLAILDDDGIELALPDVGTRRFGWAEIDRLELHRTWWRQWGELRAVDGSLLTIVPADLVYLPETWRSAPTFAEAVVRSGPTCSSSRAPRGAGRTSSVDPDRRSSPSTSPRWRGHTTAGSGASLAVLAVVGVVLFVIWIQRAP